MNPSVKTTHVIPRQLPPVRLAEIFTLLVCKFCMTTIGAYKTPSGSLAIGSEALLHRPGRGRDACCIDALQLRIADSCWSRGDGEVVCRSLWTGRRRFRPRSAAPLRLSRGRTAIFLLSLHQSCS